jgi:hypothetical protein
VICFASRGEPALVKITSGLPVIHSLSTF